MWLASVNNDTTWTCASGKTQPSPLHPPSPTQWPLPAPISYGAFGSNCRYATTGLWQHWQQEVVVCVLFYFPKETFVPLPEGLTWLLGRPKTSHSRVTVSSHWSVSWRRTSNVSLSTEAEMLWRNSNWIRAVCDVTFTSKLTLWGRDKFSPYSMCFGFVEPLTIQP